MSFYNQTIFPLTKYLNNLSELLVKGLRFADANGMKHEEMLNYRVAPDMKPLSYQIQSCCNGAKFLAARFELTENVSFADDETTFEQLQARISKTIEILRSGDPSNIEGKEHQPLIMNVKMGPFKFETGQAYVSEYALPFFYFHYSTAYCILRQMGVEIGAMDYHPKGTFVKVNE